MGIQGRRGRSLSSRDTPGMLQECLRVLQGCSGDALGICSDALGMLWRFSGDVQ